MTLAMTCAVPEPGAEFQLQSEAVEQGRKYTRWKEPVPPTPCPCLLRSTTDQAPMAFRREYREQNEPPPARLQTGTRPDAACEAAADSDRASQGRGRDGPRGQSVLLPRHCTWQDFRALCWQAFLCWTEVPGQICIRKPKPETSECLCSLFPDCFQTEGSFQQPLVFAVLLNSSRVPTTGGSALQGVFKGCWGRDTRKVWIRILSLSARLKLIC
ncbi:uncharacterized protein LOC120388073 isoform X2 [Mauremys reevesii]|uniref:uncharacterized protein LOC120388073 isoform X2 n=1 Tax=Mauremys reevesii TaxID=260615 RepID=UPI0019400DA1|nr:uncharacterized protein LOC120388073 isoform X2 [Mauremys reevesii]XP_039365562.1 uncharacterized protein LOC120388073 isoform X2 [Mauremys reevesii]